MKLMDSKLNVIRVHCARISRPSVPWKYRVSVWVTSVWTAILRKDRSLPPTRNPNSSRTQTGTVTELKVAAVLVEPRQALHRVRGLPPAWAGQSGGRQEEGQDDGQAFFHAADFSGVNS